MALISMLLGSLFGNLIKSHIYGMINKFDGFHHKRTFQLFFSWWKWILDLAGSLWRHCFIALLSFKPLHHSGATIPLSLQYDCNTSNNIPTPWLWEKLLSSQWVLVFLYYFEKSMQLGVQVLKGIYQLYEFHVCLSHK